MDKPSFRHPDIFKYIGDGKFLISYYKDRDVIFISCTPAGMTVGLSPDEAQELADIIIEIKRTRWSTERPDSSHKSQDNGDSGDS